ncbi:hypothetical protein [Pedobacter steynii]
MTHLDITLPFLILGMTYVVKLMIDENVDKVKAICSMCELPIDMIFLAISFLIAIVISDASNRNEGLFYMLLFMVLAMLNVFLAKRSIRMYQAHVNNKWVWLFVLNLFITVLCLRCSILTLTSSEITTQKNNTTTQLPSNPTKNEPR